MTCLDTGVSLFNKKQYGNAVEFFLEMVDKEPYIENRAQAQLWLGRCFYEQLETHNVTYRQIVSISSKGPGIVPAPGSQRTTTHSRRLVGPALNYFNAAIKSDKTFADAHYWKGRALKYTGKIQDAFTSYVSATVHDQKPLYVEACCDLFAEHMFLEFSPYRNLEKLATTTAIKSLSSSRAYERIEGCKALRERASKLSETEREQVISNILHLRKWQLPCFTIPFFGDSDQRVADEATQLYEKLSQKTESQPLLSSEFFRGNSPPSKWSMR